LRSIILNFPSPNINTAGLRILVDKASLQFVMKDGMIAASHVGNELPKELFFRNTLLIE